MPPPPAELKALILMPLEKKSGLPIAEVGEALQRGEQRTVMIRAHGVQRRPLDDMVGVDSGKTRPIEIRKVRLIPRRQQNDPVDAARLQDGIEARHGYAGVADREFLDLESQFADAGFRADHRSR